MIDLRARLRLERLVRLRELHVPAVRADQVQVFAADAEAAVITAGAVADTGLAGAAALGAPDVAGGQEGWVEGTERGERGDYVFSVVGTVRRHVSQPSMVAAWRSRLA